MKDYLIKRMWIDHEVISHYRVKKILQRLPEIKEVKEIFPERKINFRELSFEEAKSTLFLTKFPGNFVKPCPGTGRGYLCCGYMVINQPVGCPLDCSYCILQDYLGRFPLTLYVNFNDLTSQLDRLTRVYEGKILRIGNGELTDSLALDYLGDFSSFFISYFRKKENLIFEFKTKTDEIREFLKLSPSPNIVISWSLNPRFIVEREEHFTASLKRRLKAAHLLQERGFMLGFHFDPIIFYPEWKADYEKLIDELFSYIDPSRIFWISLGALRLTSSLKQIIQHRFPTTKIVYQEMIRGLDGKLRYIKPLRIKLFRKVYQCIKDHAPSVFCYLCMESSDVWEKVMGFSPQSNLHFRYMFEEHCKKVLSNS